MPDKALIRNEFILDEPGGKRQRELLFGDLFAVGEVQAGWARGEAAKDGYRGWLPAAALAPMPEPTHRVAARLSHVYPGPDLKLPPMRELAMNAAVRVRGAGPDWAEISLEDEGVGWVPVRHLADMGAPRPEFVSVAEGFLGTPYLWAGNTGRGLDCSGLVQVASHAAGLACPPDSGDQAEGIGKSLTEKDDFRRGDLVFWRGHVGIMRDAEELLHANAWHMAVASEPLAVAEARIEASGGGPITGRRRRDHGT